MPGKSKSGGGLKSKKYVMQSMNKKILNMRGAE